MIGDAIAVIDFLLKQADKIGVIRALFDADGSRIEGSERIIVDKISSGNPTTGYYKIRDVDDYEFVYSPVIPTLYVGYGTPSGKSNPDARYFRFVGDPMSRYASGGAPNITVKFLVVGYKPKKLLQGTEE